MRTRTDYETDPTLAVFEAPYQADGAIRRLGALGIPADAIRQTRLAQGSYQCTDPSLGEGFAGRLELSWEQSWAAFLAPPPVRITTTIWLK
jgi:hypothetical protein